ncbi:MAG TPA: hypothetical protein PLB81_00190 [Deltaproteobacteria bacterium]|nr:hypothetical protein [Deltaproteobacteria bacterium]
MTPSYWAMLLGGIIPAVFFGISGAFTKSSNQAGIGTGLYLVCIGISVTLVGVCYYLLVPDRNISLRSGAFAALVGMTWAVAAGMVALALTRYGVPVAKLAPLYNMNTLITVLIGLVFLAEWKDVQALKLMLGAGFVVIGGIIVASS